MNASAKTEADAPAESLRAWAKGLYPLEASVELLIRSGFAQSWRPWVVEENQTESPGLAWIDYEALVETILNGPLSGGERRLLSVAASLSERGGDGARIVLGDAITGLNREWVDLILAAVAHAAGSHEHSRISYDDTGRPVGVERINGSLHQWPEATR